MNLLTALLLALGVGIVGFVLAMLLAKRADKKKLDSAGNESRRILTEANKEAEIIKKEAVLEAREAWMKEKAGFDKDMDQRRREVEKAERAVEEQQSALEKRIEGIDSREKDLVTKEKTLQTRQKGIEIRENEIDAIITSQNEKLQRIAQMTPEEAKKQLMDNMVSEAKMEAAAHIKEIREKAGERARRHARGDG